jgi:hypothetical protein
MNLCQQSIAALVGIVTGEQGLTIYRSGPMLVELFNRFGANEVYGRGFPSRWQFAERQLNRINGTDNIAAVVRAALDPRDHIDFVQDLQNAAEYLNKYFRFDGYTVERDGEFFRVCRTATRTISPSEFPSASPGTRDYLDEQITKCHRKLEIGDHAGAITNARTFIETVLRDLEQQLDPNAPTYDGDIVKLNRRVQILLNLEPGRPDISGPLRQILAGLVSVTAGLAAMRNKLSDSHATSYRAREHHAKLAVNAAHTLAEFLYDTRSYQEAMGLLGPKTEERSNDSVVSENSIVRPRIHLPQSDILTG